LNNGNKVFEPAYQNVFAQSGDEFTRYRQAIGYSSNEAKFLEVETNDPRALPYFQFLMVAHQVPGLVRYLP